VPVRVLKKFFEGLHLSPGLITNPNTREAAIKQMLIRVNELTKRVIETQQFLIGDLALWDKQAIDDNKKQRYKEKLKELKDFLDVVKQYDTPAKLKNFRYSEDEVEGYLALFAVMEEMLKIRDFKLQADPHISYLTRACIIVKDEEWINKVQVARDEALDMIQRPQELTDAYSREYVVKLQALKSEYVSMYLKLHKKHRLDLNGDEQKKKLLASNLKHNLDMLSNIKDLIYSKPYEKILEGLFGLKTCFSLIEKDLYISPVCPHCNYTPDGNGQPVFGVVEAVEQAMEELFLQWEEIILQNLESDQVQNNIALLDEPQRQVITSILKNRRLPDKIDSSLVSIINTLLKGLQKVEITAEDLLNAIFKGGPVTVEDMKQHLNDYIDELVKGMDVKSIRIILK